MKKDTDILHKNRKFNLTLEPIRKALLLEKASERRYNLTNKSSIIN